MSYSSASRPIAANNAARTKAGAHYNNALMFYLGLIKLRASVFAFAESAVKISLAAGEREKGTFHPPALAHNADQANVSSRGSVISPFRGSFC